MKKTHYYQKIAAICLGTLNAIFMAVMAFIQVERTATLLALVVLAFAGIHLLCHFLSRDYLKGSKIHLTILLSLLTVLSIIFLLAKTDINTICAVWAIVDLVLCFFNITVYVIEMKIHFQIDELVELLIQVANIVIDILLLIELEEGLTLHLAFCSFELLSSTAFELKHLIVTKKHDNPMAHVEEMKGR